MTDWRLIKTAPMNERVLVRNRFADATQIAVQLDDDKWLPDRNAFPYGKITNEFGQLESVYVRGQYDYWAPLPELNFITRFDAEQAENSRVYLDGLNRAFVDDLTIGY